MQNYTYRSGIAVSDVTVAALPPETLAVWLRIGSAVDAIAVADTVPQGAVAGVELHVRSHASDPLAEALGLVKCLTTECGTARSWLQPAEVCARSAV